LVLLYIGFTIYWFYYILILLYIGFDIYIGCNNHANAISRNNHANAIPCNNHAGLGYNKNNFICYNA